MRDRKARTALGCECQSVRIRRIPTASVTWQALTRTRQTCIPFLVTVQNIERRGLAEIDTTGSGGIFGSAGMVESRRAAEVGKYMVVLHRESACYIMYNDCWNAGRPGTLRVG